MDPGNELFSRFEGIGKIHLNVIIGLGCLGRTERMFSLEIDCPTGFDNDCSRDDDCLISGAQSEVCAAENVFTTAEKLPELPEVELTEKSKL